jgi:hypothetical protein
MKRELTILLFPILVIGLRAQPVWKTARIVDSKTAQTYVDGAVGRHVPLTGTIRENEVAIVSDEFAYIINDTRKPYTGSPRPGAALATGIAHGISARHHGCRFIVGDQVKFYQTKNVIHVIDTDGKQCKTAILRQERLQKDEK